VVEIPVVIEMLEIDVGHHGNGGGQQEEGAVAFVGFRHHEIARSQLGIGAPGIEPAADHHRGVEATAGEYGGDHRGGGGLAMSARYQDRVLEAHELGQHFSPANDRDLAH